MKHIKQAKNQKYSYDEVAKAVKHYLMFPNNNNKNNVENIFIFYSVLEFFVLGTANNAKNGTIQIKKLSEGKKADTSNNIVYEEIKEIIINEQKKLVTTNMMLGNAIRFF